MSNRILTVLLGSWEMARKSWLKCRCGRKLHAKTGNTLCMACAKKERRRKLGNK
jgi:hypothetical protein